MPFSPSVGLPAAAGALGAPGDRGGVNWAAQPSRYSGTHAVTGSTTGSGTLYALAERSTTMA